MTNALRFNLLYNCISHMVNFIQASQVKYTRGDRRESSKGSFVLFLVQSLFPLGFVLGLGSAHGSFADTARLVLFGTHGMHL